MWMSKGRQHFVPYDISHGIFNQLAYCLKMSFLMCMFSCALSRQSGTLRKRMSGKRSHGFSMRTSFRRYSKSFYQILFHTLTHSETYLNRYLSIDLEILSLAFDLPTPTETSCCPCKEE